MNPLTRLRRAVRRARAIPAQVDQVQSVQHRVLHETTVREEEVLRRLDETLGHLQRLRQDVDQLGDARDAQQRSELARSEELLAQMRTLTDRVAFVEAQLEAQRAEATARFDARSATDRADATALSARTNALHHEVRTVREAVLAPQRDVAAAELVAGLDPVVERRPGVSVIMTTWNHAGWLDESLGSALAALDHLPAAQRGEVLVLDDSSTDETAQVLARHQRQDDRVRTLRSPVNLGLGRARNVLLAACRTSHAVVLDADNRLLPDGAATLLDVAQTHTSTITFGQVIASDDAGARWDSFAYAPSAASLPGGLCFDSMALVDVAAVERLGGYTVDPQLEGVVDDLELLMRTLRRGERVGYVPTVLGRYRLAAQRMSTDISDQHLLVDRIRRSYLYDDPDLDSLPIFGAHPATGVLWATPATGLAVPERPDRPEAATVARRRVALVASGGVGNLGDDAITDAVLARLRRLAPGAAVDLFSDRGRPATTGAPAPWRGTVLDAWHGLDPAALRRAARAAGLDDDRIVAEHQGPPTFRATDYDAVVMAGGGFLADPFARDLLVPRAALAIACADEGVPVLWSGQGVGPCSDDHLALVAAAARSAAAFGCRDPLSVDRLAAAAPGAATLVGDDAMSVAPAPVDHLPGLLGALERPMVVLHVRDASYLGSTSLDGAAGAADRLAHDLGGSVVGLAVNDNEPSEHELLVRLARSGRRRTRWATVSADGRPDLAVGLLERADAVVAHSFHVAMWALLRGTPAVLVTGSDYYRDKADGLAGLAGFPGSIGMEPGAAPAALAGRIDEVRNWLTDSRLGDAAAGVERWWTDLAAHTLKF